MTNFKQTKDAVSGPLAIVAAGADVARSDAASLLQFAAIVNVNLAIVNALPLPVSLLPFSFQQGFSPLLLDPMPSPCCTGAVRHRNLREP